MIELLHTDEGRQNELKANLTRDRQSIEKAVKKACTILNKLTPDGAIHGAGWILVDLIRSLALDEEQAVELSRIIQRQIERDLRIHASAARSLN
jgi:hypothetical protein